MCSYVYIKVQGESVRVEVTERELVTLLESGRGLVLGLKDASYGAMDVWDAVQTRAVHRKRENDEYALTANGDYENARLIAAAPDMLETLQEVWDKIMHGERIAINSDLAQKVCKLAVKS